jgi:hypothetical protein
MLGLDADSMLTPEALLGAVHPHDRAAAIAAMRAAAPAGEGKANSASLIKTVTFAGTSPQPVPSSTRTVDLSG